MYHGCAKASTQTRTGYPNTVLEFAREDAAAPAQKPVALLEYLVRTYTRKGELVLDNAMGLGSTGVAALKCGRKFAGIEIDAERFGVARQRIEAALESPAAPGGQDESRPTTEARSGDRARTWTSATLELSWKPRECGLVPAGVRATESGLVGRAHHGQRVSETAAARGAAPQGGPANRSCETKPTARFSVWFVWIPERISATGLFRMSRLSAGDRT